MWWFVVHLILNWSDILLIPFSISSSPSPALLSGGYIASLKEFVVSHRPDWFELNFRVAHRHLFHGPWSNRFLVVVISFDPWPRLRQGTQCRHQLCVQRPTLSVPLPSPFHPLVLALELTVFCLILVPNSSTHSLPIVNHLWRPTSSTATGGGSMDEWMDHRWGTNDAFWWIKFFITSERGANICPKWLVRNKLWMFAEHLWI